MQDGLFSASFEPAVPQGTGTRLAAVDPVARVLIESPLPHLDKLFDYAVPAELADTAVPGARVKVSFASRAMQGFITERRATSDAGAQLAELGSVISSIPVLSAEVFELATRLAARYAGTRSDVLRLAIPHRIAGAEKDWLEYAWDQAPAQEAATAEPHPAGLTGSVAGPANREAWQLYREGQAFLHHLAQGGSPRAVVTVPQGYGSASWVQLLAQAALACSDSGRGVLIVVPDQRDLARLGAALAEIIPARLLARLTAEDGPSVRYREFLRILSGQARVVVGTRSAAYAPVQNLGLVAIWDDGDDVHLEQRAPYCHAREVLLTRAAMGSGAAALLLGHARSTEAQRLVKVGWAQSLTVPRDLLRSLTPRIINAGDSFHQARDPLALAARIPHSAWQSAKDALPHGPVLVQVARAGYATSMVCGRCRTVARCPECSGPLFVAAQPAVPECRWCAHVLRSFSCRECSGTELLMSGTGVLRTAEQLGRAFAGSRVISSSAGRVKDTVSGVNTLVVATVGAEPVAEGGYAAVLLLDAEQLLAHESLRAGEQAMRRWFNAAALARPAAQGGTVVIAGENEDVMGPLIRWAPAAYAERELELRASLGFPPAVRVAALSGARDAVQVLQNSLQGQGADEDPAWDEQIRILGPVPLPEAPGAKAEAAQQAPRFRTLVFMPYALAAEVAARLKAARASTSARRLQEPAQIRFDGVDLL